jgi:hypothetical protein
VTALLLTTGIVSSFLLSVECLDGDRCTSGEDAMSAVLGIGWVGLSLLCIIAGGRGQLPGARRRRAEEIGEVLTA